MCKNIILCPNCSSPVSSSVPGKLECQYCGIKIMNEYLQEEGYFTERMIENVFSKKDMQIL